MKESSRICCFLLMLLMAMSVHAVVNLPLVSSGCNHVTYYLDETTGEYTLTTTGGDPYVYTISLPRDLEADETCLYFEYKSKETLTNFQLYFGNAWAETNSQKMGNLPRTSEWKEVEWDLSGSIQQFGWGKSGQKLRIDPCMTSGIEMMIRNVRMRKKGDNSEDPDTRNARIITEYLQAKYPCYIDNVTVGTSNVTISGSVPAQGEYSLAEVPMCAEVTEANTFIFKTPLTYSNEDEGLLRNFTLSVSRNAYRSGVRRDRILSKWVIVETVNEKDSIVSHARYADSIQAKRRAAYMPLLGKKGLGGFYVNENLSDLDSLGITSVTVNMLLNALINDKSTFANNYAYSYNGHNYNIDMNYVSSFDQIFKECYKRGIISSVILLIQPDKNHTLCHPQNDGGYYSMANLTTQSAINTYAAVITFLADRYSGTTHGRINHWILHNEVDYGTTWTNMGSGVPMITYLDNYVKSMRLVANIVSQYDQHAQVLGSYTHSWNNVSSDGIGYSCHNMLDKTVLFSQAEGDFRWGVAYHPYPQSLLEPRFWSFDTDATYSMDSQFCTFKNLEVINNWVMQSENRYRDSSKRLLFLSENGTNSRDYTQTQLKYQAAGACWAWKKVNRLDGIDGIQWHNWRDNREEFGLCIGLRRYPDDETDPNGAKPVWYVWQAAGTESEDKVFAPYLTTMGLKKWNSIFDEQLIQDGIAVPEARNATPAQFFCDLTGRKIQGTAPKAHGIYIINGKKVLVK